MSSWFNALLKYVNLFTYPLKLLLGKNINGSLFTIGNPLKDLLDTKLLLI